MRTIDRWLGLYAESHRHPTNKLIHWICVPLIVWTVVALVYAIPAPLVGMWAWLLAAAACAYYAMLSPRLAVGLALFLLALLVISMTLQQALGSATLAMLAGGVFVIAWIGQFIGHEVEGKKPSFFTDLAFLLIGPAWLMAFIYRRSGLNY